MNGHAPAWATFIEAVRAIEVEPAPFLIGGNFTAAAPVFIQSADELMDEDELPFGVAGFKRALEPLILFFAKRGIPQISSIAFGGWGVPLRVKDDEECIAPSEGVIILQFTDG